MTSSPPTSRHAQRIAAMQLLFQLEVQGEDLWQQADVFLSDRRLDAEQSLEVKLLAQHCWSQRERVDAAISGVAEHWEIGRLAGVDRAVLRLAVGELLQGKTPPVVVINEAIELAREFGAAESPQFVNGVLDAVWKKMQLPGNKTQETGNAFLGN